MKLLKHIGQGLAAMFTPITEETEAIRLMRTEFPKEYRQAVKATGGVSARHADRFLKENLHQRASFNHTSEGSRIL